MTVGLGRRAASAAQPRGTSSLVAALHGCLLLAALSMPLFDRQLLSWPWYLLIPACSYAALVMLIPGLRRHFPRLALGRLDTPTWMLTAALAVVPSLVFALGCAGFREHFSNIAVQLPHVTSAHLLLFGLIGCFLNATAEELVWRGIVYGSWRPLLGAGGALIGQAAGFGVAHVFLFHSSPAIGIVLAFLYGLVLGHLRQRSNGLAAPILAHTGMDIAILALILWPC